MKKTLFIFAGLSVGTLVFWVIFFGLSHEFGAFLGGYAIFSVNLMLWTVIVRELLEGAADSSKRMQEIATEQASNKSQGSDAGAPIINGTLDDSDNTETLKKPSKQGQVIIVGGMAMKIALLGGGIYVCLAVLKFQPIYFVSGLGAGLAFLAVAGYATRH